MSEVETRIRALLAAGPRTAADLGREALGIQGPEAIVAKVAEAALSKLPWAEETGGTWRLRPEKPPPAEGPVLLVVAWKDQAAHAAWDGNRLGEMKTSAVPDVPMSPPPVAFGSLPGVLSVRALCRAFDPGRTFTTAARAAEEWKLPHGAGEDALGALHTLAAVWERVKDMAAEAGVLGLDALREVAEKPRPRLDLAPYGFDATFLATLPETPGTYRFLDSGGSVFYVGKARNLRNRVNSYFAVPRQPDEKWLAITKRLRTIDFTIHGSELEALLDEHRLIRELKGGLLNVQEGAHARTPRKLPDRSIFVLPVADDRRAAVWLHRRGAALKRLDLKLDPRGVKGAAAEAKAFFDATRQSDPETLAIGEAWLGDNQHRIARIDPDRPDLEIALAGVLRGDAFSPGERR